MADVKILQKIVFSGTMQLDSPLSIGSGTEAKDRRNEADVHVLKDKKERPFIPGTSLAGVLRNWLAEQNRDAADKLFGFVSKNESSKTDVQSAVAVYDVVLEDTAIVLRDGVSIDTFTGTGLDGKKYDYEVVERGAKGNFNMVITLREYQENKIPGLDKLIEKLADRLYSGIRTGALTSKGFGRVSVPNLVVEYYDFRIPGDVKNWLLKKPADKKYRAKTLLEDDRNTFTVDGEFSLATSLMVRDQNARYKDAAKKINVTPVMKSRGDYLIPGTSLKGVLRHQAEKILTVLNKPLSWLDDLMGFANEGKRFSGQKGSKKSRFIVNEVYFKEGIKEKEQTRNRIDRFTGATVDSALFANKALWQNQPDSAALKIHFEIAECKEWEAGLALFLLKDLWTGNIAIGGEKSIGRGYLKGVSATVSYQGKKYVIGTNGKVAETDKNNLEKLAAALICKEKEAAKQ